MRKLLISTTALSVAISPLGTLPGFAQVLNEDGSVTGPDGSVLCVPSGDSACDLDAIIQQLQEAEAAAEAEARALEEALAAEAAARAAEEAAAAEAAAAEEAARAAEEAAAAEAAAAEEAARAAEEAAAAEAAAAEEAARAAEEAAAAEAAAAEEAARIAEDLRQQEEAAAAEAAAEAAAGEPAVEEVPVEVPVVEETPVEDAPVEEVPVDDPPVEDPPVEAPPVDEPPVEETPVEETPVEETPVEEVTAPEDAFLMEEAPIIDNRAGGEDASALMPEVLPDAVIEALPEGAIDLATGAPLDAEAAEAAAEALAEAQAEIVIDDAGAFVDPAAGLKVAEPETLELVEPVDVPVITETEVESLTQLLTVDPTAINPEALAAAETITAPPPGEDAQLFIAPADPESLVAAVTETITAETARTSSEEFAPAPVAMGDGKKSGLSDLEKAGLLVLGALAVGAIIKSVNDEREEQRRVVSNTGDRVIVLRPDGTYQVLKDDDTIIRRPGSTVRTETFRDGSTRTIVEREDGTQVVTIRDATGRVLRRATYDRLGREIVLIDDLQPEEVVVVEELPRPRRQIVISSADSDTALKRELAAVEAERAGRKFSLRQVREIPEVRALAAVLDTENVTFASGSSAIAPTEARDLADLGRLMQDLLDVNPDEVFLIEGHTDATGKAALNLALSDRRAESVALALTEYFDIPPENMVVQGYGETELLIDTQESEAANRRVEVRVITPLLRSPDLR